MRLLLFCIGTIFYLVNAIPQQKVDILSGKGISATDDKGETDSSNIVANGQLAGNFHGKKGAGKYTANEKSLGGSKVGGDAVGPGGQKEHYVIDKNTKDADITSDKGAKIKADATNPKQIVASVNGDPKKTYDVNRPNDNTAIVEPKGGGHKYQLNGIKNKDNVDVIGGPYPINSKYEEKMGADGKPVAINTRETDTFSPGTGNVRDVNTLKGDGVKTDGTLTMSNKFGKIDDPLSPSSNSLLNPSATITEEHVEAQPCVGDADGNDMLGDNGFTIVKNSIGVVYPKSGNQYKFPDCFTVKAKITIPPNVDIKTVGAEAIVYVYPSGTMQCDTKGECKDPSPGKPTGPCFFCDLCKGDTKHKFGNQLDQESNVCSAIPGQQLPLNWKVCPPQGGVDKYSAFKKNLFADGKNGDVDVVVQIYQLKVPTADDKAKLCGKKADLFSSILSGGGINPVCSPLGGNSKSWVLVGCRKSRLSYKLTGSGAMKALGNAKELSKGLPFGK